MINQVTLVGRLTKDPEIRVTTEGVPVTHVILAVNRHFKNHDGQVEADFVQCTLWRKTAENTVRYCQKGSVIGITGRIQTRHYDNQEGRRVYVTEVVAESVQFLGKRLSGRDSNAEPAYVASAASSREASATSSGAGSGAASGVSSGSGSRVSSGADSGSIPVPLQGGEHQTQSSAPVAELVREESVQSSGLTAMIGEESVQGSELAAMIGAVQGQGSKPVIVREDIGQGYFQGENLYGYQPDTEYLESCRIYDSDFENEELDHGFEPVFLHEPFSKEA